MEPKEDVVFCEDVGANHHSEKGIDPADIAGTQRPTKLMVCFAVYIGLVAWVYNFDLGYSGIVLQMPPFNRAFGTCISIPSKIGPPTEKCVVSATQQSLIAISVLFIAIGAAFAGLIGAYIGRRGTIQVGCIIILVGAGGMLGTSGNFTAYVACKCIQSLGLGQFIGSAPAYGVECMAPRRRGTLTTLFNCGLGMGNLVSAAVCLGSSSYVTDLAWQIPIICQLPLAVLLGVGVMFFPESPRWLLIQDKDDEARNSFAKFYDKDPHDIEISAQVQEVLYDIQMQAEQGARTKWTEIFHGTDLRRTLTSLLILVGTAITGARFVGIYATIFFAGVGIGNPYAINCIVAACAFIGSLAAPFLIEYGGRRRTLLGGYAGLGTCMLIIAAIGTALGATNSTARSILIAFLCLWFLVYGSCVGPSLATTAPEMHSVRLRTYGHAFVTSIYEVFSFAATFYTPYMLSVEYGNMGLNIGYFHFGLTVIIWLLVFFFVPETAGFSLEQIDERFRSGKPAWKKYKI